LLRLPSPAIAARQLHQVGIDGHGAKAVVLPVQRDHRGGGQRIQRRAAIGHAQIHGRLVRRPGTAMQPPSARSENDEYGPHDSPDWPPLLHTNRG
jgi:hypothetical protein